MNQRIKVLVEQVYGSQATEQEIKFAELIVRECADYANWYQANSRYTDIAKAIKEHFGVEE